MIPVTLYDDTFSKPDIQESVTEATALHDRWVRVFNGECPPLEGNAAFVLVFRSTEAATAQMTEHLASRVRKAWRDMAASHLDEAVLRHNDITPDYQSYMDKRLTNVYGWWLTIHVEYAKGIDIGDLSEHPEILTARRAAINHITLVNDLYSFPKELDAKEAMNAILVLMRREEYDLQGAVDKVVELIHHAEKEFESTRSDILQGHLGQKPDIKSYLDGIAHVMTGNLRWSQMSTRYFGDQHDGSFVASGQITITPKPTVHAPTVKV
ncbi:terpene synthase metal binding domain protein [Colletotrichum truncatum]|uniref:Terpene synthase metal binding domain protein n=1 Tax=Colletotrichum truncatum TaxID=5467 RepID=A0ACC3YKB4_COLTU|nr:terpene synthase metal binding domain protein [Colletotrichum truncatum]KAF6784418.1 terpene synthase metal binding domain protein [Colletotrichum truncatum]